MKPLEKAIELVESYKWFACWGMFEDEYERDKNAKKCALIAANEIIAELTQEISPSIHGFRHRYWQEVKQEIKKL